MQILGIMALLGFLAASLYYAFGLWFALDAPDMPGGLYVAMVLGVSISVAVGCGLMALMFYSSRSGHDERASGREQP